MKNRLEYIVTEICNAVFLAGLIILIVGVYYIVIKAGIPYQDATMVLQLQYAVDYQIGNILSKTGLFFALFGGIIRLIIWRKNKQSGKQT